MVKGVEVMSHWTGLDVYLPDGRKLGIVHDAVIDAESLHCTHLFVRGTPEHLVDVSESYTGRYLKPLLTQGRVAAE